MKIHVLGGSRSKDKLELQFSFQEHLSAKIGTAKK